MAGEERTKQVFGDYVSIYNFKQSVEDNATVPLYYENRIPELQLANQEPEPRTWITLLERAELDDDAGRTSSNASSPHEYHLITRDDRLEKVAEDIVLHFIGRGFPGKAMVVSIDKATAVRMFDKVQKHWSIQLAAISKPSWKPATRCERPEIEAKLEFMRETDMAVVISQSQNEIADMREQGSRYRTAPQAHGRRKTSTTKFKDPDDPFRIVFVCAMWMTGFDVPSCSTIYLDKPMRNHTLMQTIARANRVFARKEQRPDRGLHRHLPMT